MIKIKLRKLKFYHIEDIPNSNVFLVSRIFSDILIVRIEVQD